MKHRTKSAISVACAGLALTLASCGSGGPAFGPPVPGVAVVVDMGLHEFRPAAVTMHVGDSVEWRNRSLIKHTVTFDPGKADDPGDASLPPGAAAFDSGDIPSGEIFVHRFTVPGTYRYFCGYHEGNGMVASVAVEP